MRHQYAKFSMQRRVDKVEFTLQSWQHAAG